MFFEKLLLKSKKLTELTLKLALILYICDAIYKFFELIEINEYNLENLNITSEDGTKFLKEVKLKVTADNVDIVNKLTENFMIKIKKAILPFGTAYFRTPIANVLLLPVPCCSKSLPYAKIADFVTFLSVLCGIPILLKVIDLSIGKLPVFYFTSKGEY